MPVFDDKKNASSQNPTNEHSYAAEQLNYIKEKAGAFKPDISTLMNNTFASPDEEELADMTKLVFDDKYPLEQRIMFLDTVNNELGENALVYLRGAYLKLAEEITIKYAQTSKKSYDFDEVLVNYEHLTGEKFSRMDKIPTEIRGTENSKQLDMFPK